MRDHEKENTKYQGNNTNFKLSESIGRKYQNGSEGNKRVQCV